MCEHTLGIAPRVLSMPHNKHEMRQLVVHESGGAMSVCVYVSDITHGDARCACNVSVIASQPVHVYACTVDVWRGHTTNGCAPFVNTKSVCFVQCMN